MRGPARELTPWTGAGSHGGGDHAMLKDIFLPTPPSDKYLRASDERGGAASILVGIAANRSMGSREEIKIDGLVSELTPPDFAPMPARDGAVPMPARI